MPDFTKGEEKDIRDDIAWAQINGDVLRSLAKPRLSFWLLFAFAACLFSIGVACEVYQWRQGLGCCELRQPACVGAVYRDLHLLDWHEPFRDAALRDLAHHSRRLAEADLPLRGGDDDLFADDRRPVYYGALGTPMEVLLFSFLIRANGGYGQISSRRFCGMRSQFSPI